MITDEEVLYQDGKVTISTARAVLAGKTYSVSNITSVSVTEDAGSNRVWGIVLLALGLLALIPGIALRAGTGALVFGGVLALLGVLLLATQKTKYIVKIASASGEAKALVSTDEGYITKVSDALNDAIVKRG